jgi:ParB-like chromosome segregation protein Spo0J
LCQPLAVSRRPDGALTIVDGQHRASAAKLRGDIPHLPCVITSYANTGDEAAAFVALNQMRRPLSALDLFKAAVAAEDKEALLILGCLNAPDLSRSRHTRITLLGSPA